MNKADIVYNSNCVRHRYSLFYCIVMKIKYIHNIILYCFTIYSIFALSVLNYKTHTGRSEILFYVTFIV